MARSGPSRADAALLAQLERKGQHVSLPQLERWRRIGVLPANPRTHLGRGKGSNSTTTEAIAEIAEAMAVVSRRGRSTHEAILRIFTTDPRYDDLFEPALPVPDRAIRESLIWFIKCGDQTLDRRIERALRRSSDSPEDLAEIISRIAAKHLRMSRRNVEPTEEDRPWIWKAPTEEDIQNLVALTIGNFLGAGEIGAQRIAETLAAVGPSNSTAQDKERRRGIMDMILTARELAGEEPTQLVRPPTMEESILRIQNTSIERIRIARDKIATVAEMGNLYLKLRGHKDFEQMATRLLNASTESFDANMLLYAITPIAETLKTSAWHRMSSVILMILIQDEDQAYSKTLDQLSAASLPDKF